MSAPRWVGVDIEHTKQHAYHGLICLVQVTWPVVIKNQEVYQTFLVDILAFSKQEVLESLGKYLFENPKICKVLHGCVNSDVWWLAKDFGIRCCSVFDT